MKFPGNQVKELAFVFLVSNYLLQFLVAISISSVILGAIGEQGGPTLKMLRLLRVIGGEKKL
jgi:hypothetical protein